MGVAVVCSGVKSILDVGATLERLETLGVTVLGYGTDRFPGFYLHDSGFPVPWRVDSPAEVAAVLAARRDAGDRRRARWWWRTRCRWRSSSIPTLHDRVLEAGLAAAAEAGISGKEVTPFLLDFFHRETGGASLDANVRLVAAQRSAGGRDRDGRGVSRVVVLGDVMVDVVARLSGPVAVGSDSAASVSFGGGGSAANVAAWLAFAGCPPILVGRVGDDARGASAAAELRAAGVDARLAVDGEHPTGTCVVLVGPGGERSMLPDPGANAALAVGGPARRRCSRPAGTCT